LGRISEAFKADLDPLLQAVARLSAKHPSTRLILAGQQIEESDSIHLKSRLAALELRRNSLIIDNFPDYLKSPILSACDVFVSPVDSVQETFGLSIIEAMAHSKAVIASSWSGYRDLVIHGKTGFLLKTRWSSEAADIAAAMTYWSDPYQVAHYLAQRTVIDSAELEHRLAQLMENREARQEMGANGRARVIESFSWPRVSAMFLALWAEQIEQAKHIHPIRKRFLDYNRFFSHYADDLLAMEDSLFKIDAQDVTNEELESQWSFSDGSQFEQLTRILALCGNAPIRIGELRRRGFSLDCILWLVKKGLCGILPQNTT
jgi:hypothetical protein